MKKKIALLAVLVVVSVCVLCACTQDANLFKVGSDNTFDYSDLTALQKDWTLSTADGSAVSSVFSVDADNKALVVNTTSSGWARATQEVKLRADSYYLVEYNFTATSFNSYGDKGFDGLFISILEDDDFNTGDNAVQNRSIAPNKTSGRLYFKTTSAAKTTIAINLGSKDYPVSVSELKLYDIKLIKVSKAVIDAEGASYQTFSTDHYGENTSRNITWVVLGAVAIALIGYAAYVLFQRNMSKNDEYSNKFLVKVRDSKWLGIALVGGITLCVRLLVDLLVTCLAGTKLYATLGYSAEGYAAQALFIGNYGTTYLSESLSRFCTDMGYTYMAPGSNPILLFILGFIGVISKPIKANPYLAATFFIKFFASLADVGTAIFIYILIKKHAGNVGAAIAATAYAIMPVVFGMSALWGFAESITIFFIVLSVYFMLKNNYYGVAGAYMAAFLTSWTAIIFAPIVIFYSIQQAINKPQLRIAVPVAAVVGFALFYVLNLPFDILQIKAGKAFVCVTNYWDIVFKNIVYTANAFNFQALLGNNFGTVTTESLIVSIIFIVFMLALVAFGYFKFKNRMNLLLLGTTFINMAYMFGNNMVPAVMGISLALMLIYAIMNKEKRIYFMFLGYAVLSFVNISIGELLYDYTATAIYQISYETATIYVFSAFALALTLLYIYVTYDIVVSKKMRKIQPMTLTYLGWWKNAFLKVKKAYYKLRLKSSKKAA